MNKIVIVAGGDLFSIAAEYLNDATQWTRIAKINNITDPFLLGITKLIIPEINPTAGGGIATQTT